MFSSLLKKQAAITANLNISLYYSREKSKSEHCKAAGVFATKKGGGISAASPAKTFFRLLRKRGTVLIQKFLVLCRHLILVILSTASSSVPRLFLSRKARFLQLSEEIGEFLELLLYLAFFMLLILLFLLFLELFFGFFQVLSSVPQPFSYPAHRAFSWPLPSVS